MIAGTGGVAPDAGSHTEIVPAPAAAARLEYDRWERAGNFRLPLTVELPLRAFRVRDLLELVPGTVLRSECRNSDKLPLRARDTTLAQVEFEVSDGMLFARVAEIA